MKTREQYYFPIRLRRMAVLIITVLVTACQFGNTQVRTVDETMKKFDNGAFMVGKTTREEVKGRLGSPSSQKTLDGGEERWTYIKAEEQGGLFTLTTDVGTNYTAEYLFAKSGILKDKSYSAVPMGNPLLR